MPIVDEGFGNLQRHRIYNANYKVHVQEKEKKTAWNRLTRAHNDQKRLQKSFKL